MMQRDSKSPEKSAIPAPTLKRPAVLKESADRAPTLKEPRARTALERMGKAKRTGSKPRASRTARKGPQVGEARVRVRLSDFAHRAVLMASHARGVSVNQFIEDAVMVAVGEHLSGAASLSARIDEMGLSLSRLSDSVGGVIQVTETHASALLGELQQLRAILDFRMSGDVEAGFDPASIDMDDEDEDE